MNERRSGPYLSRLSAPWLLAGLSTLLLSLGGVWSFGHHYRPLVLVSFARVSGWLALCALALTLCVSPLWHSAAQFWGNKRWLGGAPRLRRLLGMTLAWAGSRKLSECPSA